MNAWVRQQAQLRKLDFLVVEGVMEMMQCFNHGAKQQVDVKSLSNHHWWEFLVTWTHGEGLGHQKGFNVLGK